MAAGPSGEIVGHELEQAFDFLSHLKCLAPSVSVRRHGRSAVTKRSAPGVLDLAQLQLESLVAERVGAADGDDAAAAAATPAERPWFSISLSSRPSAFEHVARRLVAPPRRASWQGSWKETVSPIGLSLILPLRDDCSARNSVICRMRTGSFLPYQRAASQRAAP